MKTFNVAVIADLQQALDEHPVYRALNTLDDLRCFMQHHVFSVWDFMSLIKYLQQHIAPATYPWVPQGEGSVRRFINELVLEEESDQGVPGSAVAFSSHFELYCGAMADVGADVSIPQRFIRLVQDKGVQAALQADFVPDAARRFSRTTFAFIDSGQAHTVAAALALGREKIIPAMFRAFLAQMGMTEAEAPTFHYYLKRHIHLDEDFHAPLSLRLLEQLCEGDEQKIAEAELAAQQALQARILFWDGVLVAMEKKGAEYGSLDLHRASF